MNGQQCADIVLFKIISIRNQIKKSFFQNTRSLIKIDNSCGWLTDWFFKEVEDGFGISGWVVGCVGVLWTA